MKYSVANTVSTPMKTPGKIERLDELPETQRDPFCHFVYLYSPFEVSTRDFSRALVSENSVFPTPTVVW